MKTKDKIESISILIPDGEPWDVVKVLRCFSKAQGIKAYIMSRSRLSMSRFSRYCSGCYFNESKNDKDWINELIRLVKSLKIDVVMPVTFNGIQRISQNRKKIEKFAYVPKMANSEQLEMSNNKWEFYKNVKKMGLPVLPTIFIGKAGEEIDNYLDHDSVEFPALLKPTSQKGGDGIVRVDNSSDLKYTWCNGQIIKDQQYILQTLIDAERFSLSVCCQDGEIIAYTLQRVLIPSKDPYQPGTTVEYIYNKKVFDVGKRLLKDMKWNGIADIDLLVDKRDQTIYVLEFNPRLWQSLLGSLISGVNIPYIWCLNALGINKSCSQRENVKYTRPASFIRMVLLRLIGIRPPINISWKECDLQFTIRDPFPELFRIIIKPVIWFRYKRLARQ